MRRHPSLLSLNPLKWAVVILFVAAAAAIYLSTGPRRAEASVGDTVPRSVQKGVDFLTPDVVNWTKSNSCIACHRQGGALNALSNAKSNGYLVDTGKTAGIGYVAQKATEDQQPDGRWTHFGSYTTSKTSYAFFGLAGYDKYVSTEYSASLVKAANWAVSNQVLSGPIGYWAEDHGSFPTTYGNVPVTARMMVGIAQAKQRVDSATAAVYQERLDRAAGWLRATQDVWRVSNNFELAYSLIGLKAAGASNTDADVVALRDMLLGATSRPTGRGWGYLYLYEADEYNTGTVLYALGLAGVRPAENEKVRDAINWLRDRQIDDSTTGGGFWRSSNFSVADIPTTFAILGLSSFGELGVELSVNGPDRKVIRSNVQQSQTVTYDLTITNHGAFEVTDTYNLSVQGGLPGWDAAVEPFVVTLPSGQSAPITVTVTAPPGLPEALPVEMTVIATSQTDPKISAQAKITTYTDPPPPTSGDATETTFVSGANAVVTSRHDAQTVAARVKDTVSNQFVSGPGRGVVTFYVAGVAVGTDRDADGDGLFRLDWVPGDAWNASGTQDLRAVYSGIDLPEPQVDLLPSFAASTITISLPAEQPPTVGAGGPYTVAEGSSIVVGATGNNPSGGALAYAWDMDNDGSFETPGPNAVFSARMLSGPGLHTLRVEASAGNGLKAVAQTAVNVLNVVPFVAVYPSQSAAEGSSSAFDIGWFSDPGPDSPWALDLDWGDGSGHSASVVQSAGALGKRPHLYADNGVYNATLSVTDKDGASDSKTFRVNVFNVPPTVNAAADQTADAGVAKPFTLGSFTDPGPDAPWGIDVDWGDGSPHTTSGDLPSPGQGALNPLPHTYAADGVYNVTVKVTDKDGGVGSATFRVTVSDVAVVRHAPALSGGRVEGIIYQLSGEDVALGGGDVITSALKVPGTPTLLLNGQAIFGGTLEGIGSAQPSGYLVKLSGTAELGQLVTRTDPVAMPLVAAPPATNGTRDVTLNSAAQKPGSFATLRDLTLGGTVGMVAVPAGTYRNFTAAGSLNGFTLGVAGASRPSVYNLNSLTLNGRTRIEVVGPVVINLTTGLTVNGGAVGSSSGANLLRVNVAQGGLKLDGKAFLYGTVAAPSGNITVTGRSVLTGGIFCDSLSVNGGGVLSLPKGRGGAGTDGGNRPPSVDAGPDQAVSLPTLKAQLNGNVTDDGLPAGGRVTTAWNEVSGPGTVSFADASAPSTAVTFGGPGTYVLRLTASDSQLSASDDVVINVGATNQAPYVNAGLDRSLTWPADGVTLDGAAIDDGLPAGQPLAVSWSKVSGPGAVAFASPNQTATAVSFGAPGVYVLRLTASDSQLTAADDVVVSFDAANQPPTVSAGPDQTISLPTNSVSLQGSVGDDGLPVGGTLSVLWKKVSGPGTVTFGNPAQAATSATFSAAGTYLLRLTASDTQLTNADEVVVTVTPANKAPSVEAGPDQTITLPQVANLSGMISDDGLPAGGTLTITWAKVSGPGNVSFSNPHTAAPIASFSVAGSYLLRLTASDSEFTISDDVRITVRAANQAPVVSAGADLNVTLPDSAALGGVVTDDGLPAGGTLAVQWSAISGPGSVSFGNPNQPSTTASFAVAGTYVLRLTASDSELTGSDDVTVNVSRAVPVNQPPTVEAGPDQTITLPAGANLVATVTDDGLPDDGSITVEWTKATGPGSVTFSNPDRVTTSATFSAPGTYVLSIVATDSLLVSKDSLTVTVNPPSNQPPHVEAGADRTVTAGVNLLQNSSNESPLLGGEIPGWTEVEGGAWTQAPADFPNGFGGATYFYAGETAHAELRQDVDVRGFAAGVNAGTQQFELKGYVRSRAESPADSSQVILEYRDVTNTVVLGSVDSGPRTSSADWLLLQDTRTPPPGTGWLRLRLISSRNSGTANDGYFDALTLRALSAASVKLDGTVADDGLPTGAALTVNWTKVSGPGAVNFFNPNQASTQAGISTPGVYVLRLSATDSQLSAGDDLTVVVNGPNQRPAVEAGPDQTVTLPADATLNGAASDDGLPAGAALSVAWTKVSGPGVVTFFNARALSTTASFGSPGTYVLRLSADDSDLFGSDDITITVKPTAGNQAPVVNAGADQSLASVNEAASLQGTVTDDGLPTGHGLTALWAKVSGPGSVAFADAGQPATSATFGAPGRYVLRLSVSDSELTGSDDVVIAVDGTNRAPTVSAGPDQTVTLPAAAALNGSADDDGLPLDSTLAVNWTKVSGPGVVTFSAPASAATAATFGDAGTYVLRLAATDGQLTASDDVTVNVNPAEPPPAVSITSPADEAEITTRANVIGSVSGGTWKLEYSLTGDEGAPTQWVTLNGGGGAVSGAPLGLFDPTLLLNGHYLIRLSTVNANGQAASAAVGVVVNHEQKVGNFSVTFTDLSTPVSGLPIEITRTYDSRDRRVGDFGAGWTLGVRNVRVQESRAAGAQWQGDVSGAGFPTYCINPSKPHVVTVTLTNGRVYKFELTLSPGNGCQLLAPLQEVTVGFRPLPGTNATLTPLGQTTLLVAGSFPGAIQLLDSDTVDAIDYDQYQLTLEDGTTLIIDQQVGLQSLADTNGNTLSVSDGGIIHSSGKSVAFTRDSRGRITQITDPAGNSMTYAYDAAGNLVSFKDREGNVTTFTYNGAHGLLTINDPRGVQPLRNEYDDEGRLIRQVDAFNKEVKFTHDLDARQEVVFDRLGRATVYEYDARGNVLRVQDADGKVTTRTYDGRDNLLSETDALGRTKTFTYDTQDNRLTETDALNNITKYTYNGRKQVLTVTDPANGVTTYTYDANGNQTSVTDALGNITTSTYSANGLQLTSTDALGRVTSFEYDAPGNLVKRTDPLDNITTYTYDANGNRLSQSESRNVGGTTETLTTTFEYDKLGRRTKITYPDGSTTQTVYNSIGKQTATLDQLGRRTSYEYDDMGQLVRTTYPDGTREESEYDFEGRRTKSIDRAGRTTVYAYDALGRLKGINFPDASTTTNTYDAAGQVTATVDALGHVTHYEYDLAGRRTKVTNALGRETVFGYDGRGNQISVKDAKGEITRYVYDANNRRTQVIFPDDTRQTTAYDDAGQVTARIDQANVLTGFEYDKRGKLSKVTDALGGVTRYTYDEQGNQITQTDAKNHTTSYAYDRVGRRTRRTLPLGMSETYAYDLAGNLTSRTDFRGKTTAYAYDSMNRLLRRTPDASLGETAAVFTYTATGRRETMADSSGTTQYAYDARDRLLSKTTPQGTLTYTYDLAGNVKSLRSSNADGVAVNYNYDELNRLSTVVDTRLAAGTTAYAYDPNGNLESTTYPNAVRTAYTYNKLNRLTNVNASKGSTLASYAYTLGAAGNRLSVTEVGNRTVSYTYDALYRLTRETVTDDAVAADNGSINYTYDAVGNRLNRASTVGAIPTTALAYDDNDRLTTDAYDANGNTIASNGNAYQYDSENRLTSLNGGAATFVYDGDGNRVSKTVGGVTTRYLVDTNNHTGHAQVVEELVGSAVLRTYTYGHDLISQTQLINNTRTTHFYGYDGHGSTRYLTDAAGTITDTYTYDAFGSLLSRTGATPNDHLYAGEQLDADLGFYYLRARYMSPAAGRFLVADQFPSDAFDPRTLHRYTYALNNPANMIDPSGKFADLSSLMSTVSLGTILSQYQPTFVTAGIIISGVELFFRPGFALRNLGMRLLTTTDDPETMEDAVEVIRGGNRMISMGAELIEFADSVAGWADIGFGLGRFAKSFKLTTVAVDSIEVTQLLVQFEMNAVKIDDDGVGLIREVRAHSGTDVNIFRFRARQLEFDILELENLIINITRKIEEQSTTN